MTLLADNFLAGSLLSLLLPIGLLIAIAVWYVLTVRHIPKDTPESSSALPSSEVLAAGVDAGIESAGAQVPADETLMRAGTVVPEAPRRVRRVRRVEIAGALLLAVLTGAAIGVAVHRLSPASASPPHSVSSSGLYGQATWAAGRRAAPAITTLRDQTGHRFSLAGLRGRTVAIEFWDSHCNQECPLAGRALAAAERPLPRAQRPVLVVVSVNPLDTPASSRAAIRRWKLAGAAPWHWLMGTHAQLAPIWNAYRIAVVPGPTDIAHTEALYLIDRQGDERSGYLYPYIPARVAHDMRMLSQTAGTRAVHRA